MRHAAPSKRERHSSDTGGCFRSTQRRSARTSSGRDHAARRRSRPGIFRTADYSAARPSDVSLADILRAGSVDRYLSHVDSAWIGVIGVGSGVVITNLATALQTFMTRHWDKQDAKREREERAEQRNAEKRAADHAHITSILDEALDSIHAVQAEITQVGTSRMVEPQVLRRFGFALNRLRAYVQLDPGKHDALDPTDAFLTSLSVSLGEHIPGHSPPIAIVHALARMATDVQSLLHAHVNPQLGQGADQRQ